MGRLRSRTQNDMKRLAVIISPRTSAFSAVVEASSVYSGEADRVQQRITADEESEPIKRTTFPKLEGNAFEKPLEELMTMQVRISA